MMKYEIFKEVVAEKFLGYMPEKYKNMQVDIQKIEKVNRNLDGITLRSGKEREITPTLYINDMYEHYLNTEDLQLVLSNAAERMDRAFAQVDEIGQFDLDTAKENIVFQFVNTLQNRDMLLTTPHREFHDLSIIYRLVVKMDKESIQSTVIHDTLAKELGLNEEQLYNLAVENTKRILPTRVTTIRDELLNAFLHDGMPIEAASAILGQMPEDKTMWIITNEKGINGAINMLYEENLHKIAEEVESDLYILPSSTHEVLAISSDYGEPYELAKMVEEINHKAVLLEERLSNQVYHYDKETRRIALATDTPNKRLDGIVQMEKVIHFPEQSR